MSGLGRGGGVVGRGGAWSVGPWGRGLSEWGRGPAGPAVTGSCPVPRAAAARSELLGGPGAASTAGLQNQNGGPVGKRAAPRLKVAFALGGMAGLAPGVPLSPGLNLTSGGR